MKNLPRSLLHCSKSYELQMIQYSFYAPLTAPNLLKITSTSNLKLLPCALVLQCYLQDLPSGKANTANPTDVVDLRKPAHLYQKLTKTNPATPTNQLPASKPKPTMENF